MTDIAELKRQRGSSKGTFTKLFKKLKTALKVGDSEFKTLYQSVDAEYDKLIELDPQVTEL